MCVNRSNCDSFALCISLSLSFSLSVSLSLASSLALLLSLSLSLSLSLFSSISLFLSLLLCFYGSHLHTSSTPFLLARDKLSELEAKQKGPLSRLASIAKVMSNTFLSLPSSVHLFVSLLRCCLYRPPLPGQ